MAVVKLIQQENKSGDASLATQGYGRLRREPTPSFDPRRDADAAVAYFEAHGFVVLSNCLTADEVAWLNDFCDRSQAERPDTWGLGERRKPHHRNQGLIYSQPLLDYPELDAYTRHPSAYPIVCRLLGGEEHVRFSEFNLRETPEGGGFGAMNFHHDAVREDRFTRAPYNPVDWLCAIHYLTDTGPGTPAFCVVPGSNRYETLSEAHEALGEAYCEAPLYAPAGACILYDTATHHTRLDGDGHQLRRTWHQYYARGGWLRTEGRYIRPPSPVLTDWNLFPERLAMSPNLATRRFFSHWNTAMGEWAASGFDPEVRAAMPRGEQ
jgi:hypothetical protein